MIKGADLSDHSQFQSASSLNRNGLWKVNWRTKALYEPTITVSKGTEKKK